MQESKLELRRTWDSAAPGWARWESSLSAGLSDATDLLIEMAETRPGMRVLDLACGAGVQTLRVAERIGPTGTVLACDISGTMLEHVREKALRAGLQSIRTLECAAEDLDESHGPFDAAISRLGLMPFASPRRAAEAVLRALKPGARFAALVFTTPDNNPFMSRSMAILLRHAGRPAPQPGQPGIFALGGLNVLRSLMEESGFSDVGIRSISARFTLPSADSALEMMQQAFGAYRAVLADLGPAEREKAWSDVRDYLGQLETGGRFETDLEFIIGSGARPSR